MSSLLEPATDRRVHLSAGLIQYALRDGIVAEEVCYWRDMIFFPHLINLLTKRRIQAWVHFTETQAWGTDCKELARILHSEVLKLTPGSLQPQRNLVTGVCLR